MQKKRVIVIGDDVVAMLAGYELSRRGNRTTIFHGGRLGQIAFDAARRPSIVNDSERFLALLQKLDLPYSHYRTRTGILLQDEVHLYPNHLRELGSSRGREIRASLFRKSRLVDPSPAEQITDYEALIPKSAVRFNWHDFVKKLGQPHLLLDTSNAPIAALNENNVQLADGQLLRFDHVLVTLPLWKIQRLASWKLPDSISVAINSITVSPNRRDKFAGWDSVWTPYTPDGLVHRLVQHEDGYHVQFSGSLDDRAEGRLIGDLNFLFPDGWHPNQLDEGCPGYMFPLAQDPEWPQNVRPLGRFAAWDERQTIDASLDRLHQLVSVWRL